MGIDEIVQYFFVQLAQGLSTDTIANKLVQQLHVPKADVSVAHARVKQIAGQGWAVEGQYWAAVRARLLEDLSEDAVDSVHDTTERILAHLTPAQSAEFHDRGLVLGNVQSGKTTNFLSLAAKAVDNKYRLVVILSGTTNSLREQTQSRVDEILIGTDEDDWHRLTDLSDDFTGFGLNAAQMLTSNVPLIAVVKKNPFRLRRLLKFLEAAGTDAQKLAPMILIDDEADLASLDAGGKRRSTINSLLLRLLRHPRSAYVAYTATPFANVLVDPANPEDLYPRNFIISMPRPTGYFGAAEMFGAEDEDGASSVDMVRLVPSSEAGAVTAPVDPDALDAWRPEVGPELLRSLRWFLLATAARRVRDATPHHSTMLIHTSERYKAHFALLSAVRSQLELIVEKLETKDPLEELEFRELWEDETRRLSGIRWGNAAVQWVDILPQLEDLARSTRLIADNYKSADRLSYAKGASSATIVIGGNTLSRGLTLLGLCASFFVRTPGTYASRLQMSRWFGFRAGYEDLCRVWMTEGLIWDFQFLSRVEQELRDDIRRYELQGISPLDQAVRIRTHDSMAVAMPGHLKVAQTIKLSFSESVRQTLVLWRTDAAKVAQNHVAVRRLGAAAASSVRINSASEDYVFGEVPFAAIKEFLSAYSAPPDHAGVEFTRLVKYLELEATVGAPSSWRVAFVNGGSGAEPFAIDGVGPIRLTRRSRLDAGAAELARLGALAPGNVRARHLEPELQQADLIGLTASEMGRLRHAALPNVGIIRIYVLDKDSAPSNLESGRARLDAIDHLIGVSLDLPAASNPDSSVEYVRAPIEDPEVTAAGEEAEDADAADEGVDEDVDE